MEKKCSDRIIRTFKCKNFYKKCKGLISTVCILTEAIDIWYFDALIQLFINRNYLIFIPIFSYQLQLP